MVLRLLRLVNRLYPWVALAAYMLAFAVAFVCVFTFPLGALALVVMGVLSLAVVAVARDGLQAVQRLMQRGWLRRGRCPACRMGPVKAEGSGWRCRGCAQSFDTDGAEATAAEPAVAIDAEMAAA
jgi:ribosomal protein L37AE/L43A